MLYVPCYAMDILPPQCRHTHRQTHTHSTNLDASCAFWSFLFTHNTIETTQTLSNTQEFTHWRALTHARTHTHTAFVERNHKHSAFQGDLCVCLSPSPLLPSLVVLLPVLTPLRRSGPRWESLCLKPALVSWSWPNLSGKCLHMEVKVSFFNREVEADLSVKKETTLYLLDFLKVGPRWMGKPWFEIELNSSSPSFSFLYTVDGFIMLPGLEINFLVC